MPATKTRKLNTPYADLLPPLKTSEREALAADIAVHGVLHPIVIDEDGNILDGHHRYSIDRKAPTVTVKGAERGRKAGLHDSCQPRAAKPHGRPDARGCEDSARDRPPAPRVRR